jgi:hypothetical protein
MPRRPLISRRNGSTKATNCARVNSSFNSNNEYFDAVTSFKETVLNVFKTVSGNLTGLGTVFDLFRGANEIIQYVTALLKKSIDKVNLTRDMTVPRPDPTLA